MSLGPRDRPVKIRHPNYKRQPHPSLSRLIATLLVFSGLVSVGFPRDISGIVWSGFPAANRLHPPLSSLKQQEAGPTVRGKTNGKTTSSSSSSHQQQTTSENTKRWEGSTSPTDDLYDLVPLQFMI